MLVISVMLSIVFCGGMIPVTARPILVRCPGPHRPAGVSPPQHPQPTFRCSNPGRSAPKTRTVPTPSAWLFDMAMLVAHSVFNVGFVRWKIRLTSS
jgi:hypothetical protein